MQSILDYPGIKLLLTAIFKKQNLNKRSKVCLEQVLKQEEKLKWMENEKSRCYKRYFLG